MYYSIPHASLVQVLRCTIETQGLAKFQNAAGISLDTFMEVLSCYLSATVVTYEDRHYVQKSGVCIGSQVAPHLCDVFLAACGVAIQQVLKDPQVAAVFRYVDDFLILCTTEADETADGCLNNTLRHFHASCMGLKFTYELPANKTIRFLDLALTFQKECVLAVSSAIGERVSSLRI